MTEDKMVGWHHRLDGHESEQGPCRCCRKTAERCTEIKLPSMLGLPLHV